MPSSWPSLASRRLFERLQQLVGRTLPLLGVRTATSARDEGAVRCTLTRALGTTTVVASPDGRLHLRDLAVALERADD